MPTGELSVAVQRECFKLAQDHPARDGCEVKATVEEKFDPAGHLTRREDQDQGDSGDRGFCRETGRFTRTLRVSVPEIFLFGTDGGRKSRKPPMAGVFEGEALYDLEKEMMGARERR